uniref:UCH domain-containing protein n=1 Tax=Ascaris lumbricoides TaxID=6252 RepID=A0A0M3HLK2_ASCLU
MKIPKISKFSHDADADRRFCDGSLGAGTNNAKLVSVLRQLASYHHRDQVQFEMIDAALANFLTKL